MRLVRFWMKRTVMGITVGWRIGPSPKFRTAPRGRFPVTFCLGFVRRFMQAARAETVTRLHQPRLSNDRSSRILSKHFQDKKRGEIRAVDGVSFPARQGRFMVCWAPTERERRRHCACSRRFWSRPRAQQSFADMTWSIIRRRVRASVGFLSTATALYPRLTAREVVQYFGRLNGLDEVR